MTTASRENQLTEKQKYWQHYIEQCSHSGLGTEWSYVVLLRMVSMEIIASLNHEPVLCSLLTRKCFF